MLWYFLQQKHSLNVSQLLKAESPTFFLRFFLKDNHLLSSNIVDVLSIFPQQDDFITNKVLRKKSKVVKFNHQINLLNQHPLSIFSKKKSEKN